MSDTSKSSSTRGLEEIAILFIKLGTTAFGGPAAHIAMMEDEVVRRKKWMSREHFLDLLGATHFIPGPNSTEMAIHVGYERAGWKGLVVAGICFIAPAVLIVSLIAWAYVQYGSLPQVEGVLYGIKPAIIAIVIQALWGLGMSALKTWKLAVIAVLAAVANIFGLNEVLTIFLAGLLALGISKISSSRSDKNLVAGMGVVSASMVGAGTVTAAVPIAATAFSLSSLFFVFLKIGSVLFGSGYVLLAFLRADLVQNLGWLTEGQILDATAVGQFTPGPVFTTATFVGYILSGPMGAFLATVGIFLPAFIFVGLSAPFIPKIRKSPTARNLLDGINAASLALMGVVAWYLAKVSIVDPQTIFIFVVSAILLIRFRINSVWLVLAGALIGIFGITNG